MILFDLFELFEVLEELTVSLVLMVFAAVLSLLLFKAKNYVTERLTGSKESLSIPSALP
jgi:hypothetical protein